MRVEELMQQRVATVQADVRLNVAVALMREHDCGSVVVVDDTAHVQGVLTDRDVCLAALRNDRPLSAISVAAAMSGDPVLCRVGDTIDAAERTMGLHQVRRLPVVDDDGVLRGVLALDDVAREACRDADLLVPPVSCAAVGRTLGEIVRPRLLR